MITTTIRVNELSGAAFSWYQNYLAYVDNKDLEGYGKLLAEDCELRINNESPVEGRSEILAGLDGYWQSFRSVTHELLNIYGNDSNFVLEALNHYERHDGEKVTLRAVAFTDRNGDGLVTSVRLYTDTTPLFAD